MGGKRKVPWYIDMLCTHMYIYTHTNIHTHIYTDIGIGSTGAGASGGSHLTSLAAFSAHFAMLARWSRGKESLFSAIAKHT